MSAHLKIWITLSLALHLAVLGWAAPGRKLLLQARTPAVERAPVMVTLSTFAERPTEAAVRPDTAVEPRKAAAGSRGGAVESPEDPAGDPERAPVPRVVRKEEFDRMAYLQEMAARTMSYCRNASKGFEGILRSALPADTLREDGKATVSIELTNSGELNDVDIRSDSPALFSALREVPWETAPLPGRFRIPCKNIQLNVSVLGNRLAVSMKLR